MYPHNKKPYPPIFDICRCNNPNCNEIVWGGRQFISGHNAKTIEGRKILSIAHKNKPPNNKGKPSILKGRKHKNLPSQSTRDLWSKQRKGIPHPNKGRLGKAPWNKGLIGVMPEPWNKGKPYMQKGDHPLWKGGVSFLPYCPKFDNKFKKSIRQRDNEVCQLCGKTTIENGRKLDVHHIHHDKENCYPDCIALCKRCNLHEVERRDKIKYYEDLFMNMLNNRELLFWSKRRELE